MSFRRIVGQTRLLSLLSRAVARGTLPPALLLSGPAGVGKRRAALAVAQALNCAEPWSNSPAGEEDVAPPGRGTGGLRGSAPRDTWGERERSGSAGRSPALFERDACGACAACRRIERGLHPDVIVVEPGETGSIKIDQVRDVIEQVGYRPFEGARRVVIIDEADAMMVAAQNALLKTLEEPPPSSLFLLVSSMSDALLATVRSRCSRLRFGPLSPAEVAEVLIRDHGYRTGDAHAAAALAGGSVGSALSAGAADVADARETARRLLEQTARATDPVRRLEAARDLAVKKRTAAEERAQLAALLRALGSLLRDVALVSTRADARALANADLAPQLLQLSRAFGIDRAMRAYTAVDRALGALERNASPKVVADWLVLQW
jgi:DNA polymerase-3 subunit delta'